ncbi:hypothetical protein IAT40_005430 [Kwoniella sp. CBS 6097]
MCHGGPTAIPSCGLTLEEHGVQSEVPSQLPDLLPFEQTRIGTELATWTAPQADILLVNSPARSAVHDDDLQTYYAMNTQETAHHGCEQSPSLLEGAGRSKTDTGDSVVLTKKTLQDIRAFARSRNIHNWVDASLSLLPTRSQARYSPASRLRTLFGRVTKDHPDLQCTFTHWDLLPLSTFKDLITKVQTSFSEWQKDPESEYSRHLERLISLSDADQLAQRQAKKASQLLIYPLQRVIDEDPTFHQTERSIDQESLISHLLKPWSDLMKANYRRIISSGQTVVHPRGTNQGTASESAAKRRDTE